jgi:hypothetical protein
MTQKQPKDIAASVRQRLLNKAHADTRAIFPSSDRCNVKVGKPK